MAQRPQRYSVRLAVWVIVQRNVVCRNLRFAKCVKFQVTQSDVKRAAMHGQELIRRWDSERELLRSAPRKLPEFAKITQNNAITPFKVIKVTDFDTNRKLIYDFLLVINTNLPPILLLFRDIAFDRSKIAIFGYPSCLIPTPDGVVPYIISL